MCFLAGSFLLGVTEGGKRELDWKNLDQADQEDYMAGTGLMETCVDTYNTPTGLGAEIVMFRMREDPLADEEDWYIKSGTNLIDSRNILRPETVESLFLAYRLTGDERYRDYGWKIFQAFEKHCKVDTGGYANIRDVRVVPAEKEDRMETFWLSETLSEYSCQYHLNELTNRIPVPSVRRLGPHRPRQTRVQHRGAHPARVQPEAVPDAVRDVVNTYASEASALTSSSVSIDSPVSHTPQKPEILSVT